MLPQWIQNLSILFSIFGFVVTCFLLIEARDIKNSFLRKARIPEIVTELTDVSGKLARNLKKWDAESSLALERLEITKGLLESIEKKLPGHEKKKVSNLISKLNVKKWIFFKVPISVLEKDQAWDLYTELSGVITSLKQLEKDSKWD